MYEQITAFLSEHYGLAVQELHRMTTGVGGDTFRVDTADACYVFKIAKAGDINHPESEAEICHHLRRKGIPVSEFLSSKSGAPVSLWPDQRTCHLQHFIDGKNHPMNSAPSWFLRESPLLLARIHLALTDFHRLPEGIGAGFFTYMTPSRAIASYRHSIELARQRNEDDIAQALQLRIRAAEKVENWRIDPSKLTCRSTHGDYTVTRFFARMTVSAQ